MTSSSFGDVICRQWLESFPAEKIHMPWEDVIHLARQFLKCSAGLFISGYIALR